MIQEPGVNIEHLNGQLGRVESVADRVMGIITSGVAVTDKIQLGTPHQLFGTDGAKDFGLSEAENPEAWHQISKFYERAGEGQEMWIMLVSDTTTLEDICDLQNDILTKLKDASNDIAIIGVNRIPDAGYTPSITDKGVDDDVYAAMLKAQIAVADYRSKNKPFRVVIGGREYTGVPQDVHAFDTEASNGVQMCFHSLSATGNPAIGHLLGQYANRKVNRKISRTKNGDGNLQIAKAYYTSGGEYNETESKALNAKSVVVTRKWLGRSGFYFMDDHMCCPTSDDYHYMNKCRTIDKMHKLTYIVYTDEIHDEILLDDNGFMNGAAVKGFQERIVDAISDEMIDNGKNELSSVECIINPNQNLSSSDYFTIQKVGGIPTGSASQINISLGFTNPANQA